jgi:hypothetical protein
MIKKITLAPAVLAFFAGAALYAGEFEELDKMPEGAHSGQMVLAASATLGTAMGSIIDAESRFVRISTYTFLNSGTTKFIKVSHLSFSYNLQFEYMPIDHLGLHIKGKRASIIQRSMFGSDYENWARQLYSDYSIYLGPAVHATNRRQWDFSLTPLVGYAFGTYTATPIAKRLIYTSSGLFYGGIRRKAVNNLTLGAVLSFSIYFSGGFYMSIGPEWTMNMLKFKSKFYLLNPQTGVFFFPNKSESNVHSVSFNLTMGYAFSN